MKILSIESSCDETSAAVVEDGTTILSTVIASSKELHEKTGGIIPEIAAREQLKCIIPVVEEALQSEIKNHESGISGNENRSQLFSSIDAIAVTVGPGLIGSLLVGVETAKTIAMVTGKPVIPVNHIFAHIYANFINNQRHVVSSKQQKYYHNEPLTADRLPPTFPAVALVASGGHTELFLMSNHGSLKWLGGTMDDAAGEAFDKTARMIGLGYGGGAAIAALAAKFPIFSRLNRDPISKLPRPMMHDKSLNFSFSGLKTAVMREIHALEASGNLNDEAKVVIAHEIQESITDVLVKKTLKTAELYNVSSILLGGGVAANRRLREKFESEILDSALGISLHVPLPALCTDNAAVIASYAYFHNNPVDWRTIEAQPNLSVEVG